MKTQRVNALSRGSVVNQLTLIRAATHNRQRVSRLPSQKRDVTPVYKRSNFAGKPPFSATFGTLGAPSSRQSRLSMSMQQYEIGLEGCPPRRPRNPVAGVPENCNIEFGLWKPNTSSFRVGDQLECTMEKEVRRHQKIHLALAIAGGESIAACNRQSDMQRKDGPSD